MLLAYVNNGGNIFVQDLSNDSRQGTHTNLYRLTGGKVTGVQRQGQTHADLFFSSSAPTITDVFTGLSFVSIYPRHDQALLLSADTSAKPLLGRHNSAGDYFCFFAECSAGSGNVFVSSANDTMAWIYLNEAYNVRFAPTVLPAMMTLNISMVTKRGISRIGLPI